VVEEEEQKIQVLLVQELVAQVVEEMVHMEEQEVLEQ
tara:strand:+ start:314 stop:424 length:111 start_codon:yes stop_codon:yes gene_type:complete